MGGDGGATPRKTAVISLFWAQLVATWPGTFGLTLTWERQDRVGVGQGPEHPLTTATMSLGEVSCWGEVVAPSPDWNSPATAQ